MNSQERVRAVIEGKKPDRIPIHGWIRGNIDEKVREAFGSVEAFEDAYEFDLAHVYGGSTCEIADEETARRIQAGEIIEPPEIADLPLSEPDVDAEFEDLRKILKHHKEERGRFCYVQTPGILEELNRSFGIEDHLAYLLEYPDEMKQIYAKQAEWNKRYAEKCLEVGVDMIHVSDDWGSQRSLLISPDTWWEMIYPYHKIVTDRVKELGGYVSLHSDGDINAVVDGIKQLGYNVVHPWQESAGMSYEDFLKNHRSDFSIMGGYDVQDTLGFGKRDKLKGAAGRVASLFKDGGLLFCTTHMVQNHCSIEELTYAYDLIYRLIRE